MGLVTDAEVARRARAAERSAGGMTVERIEKGSGADRLLGTPEERMARVAALTRSAWTASGRTIVKLPRSEWPGEVFVISDERARRSAS